MEGENKSIKLIQTGAEIIGAVVGGAIGLIGGPIFTIGGSVVGVTVSKTIGEFAERLLSNREKARVGASAGLTIIGVQENLDKGIELRQDGFFDSNEINRSRAEELFEGILMKCKNEFEEKKIKFISNIYKNVAFDSSINPDNANQILNSVQQFSYRQLSILSLIGQNINNSFSLRLNDYRDDYEKVTTEKEFLLQDFILLEKQGLICRNDNITMLDTSDVIAGLMKLTQIGIDYFKLINLERMTNEDFKFSELLKD